MLASSPASSLGPVKRSPSAFLSSGAAKLPAKQTALSPLAPLSSGAAAQQRMIKQNVPNIESPCVESVKCTPSTFSSCGAAKLPAKQTALPPLAPLSSGAAAQQRMIKQNVPNTELRPTPHVVSAATASSLSLPSSSGAGRLPAKPSAQFSRARKVPASENGSIRQSLPPPLAPLSFGAAALPIKQNVPGAFEISSSVVLSRSSSASNKLVRKQEQKKDTLKVDKRSKKITAKIGPSAVKPLSASEVYSSLNPLSGLDIGLPLMNNVQPFDMKQFTSISVGKKKAAPFFEMSPLVCDKSEMDKKSSDTLSSTSFTNDSLTPSTLHNATVNSRADPNLIPTTSPDIFDNVQDENEPLISELPLSVDPSSLAKTRTPVHNGMLLREIKNLREIVEHSIQSKNIGPATENRERLFHFSPLNTGIELEEFDALLGIDDEFRKNILTFVLRKAGDNRVNYIAHRAIDIIFQEICLQSVLGAVAGGDVKKFPLRNLKMF